MPMLNVRFISDVRVRVLNVWNPIHISVVGFLSYVHPHPHGWRNVANCGGWSSHISGRLGFGYRSTRWKSQSRNTKRRAQNVVHKTSVPNWPFSRSEGALFIVANLPITYILQVRVEWIINNIIDKRVVTICPWHECIPEQVLWSVTCHDDDGKLKEMSIFELKGNILKVKYPISMLDCRRAFHASYSFKGRTHCFYQNIQIENAIKLLSLILGFSEIMNIGNIIMKN